MDFKYSHWLRRTMLLTCASVFGACTTQDLLKSDNQRINQLRVGSSNVIAPNPRDGDLHMANGYAFLQRAKNSPSGFYFARSAFERASVIKVDDAIPEYLTGYSFFALGQYNDASRAFVSAALLDRSADGWWLASLSALRAGNEITAQSLYDQGKLENNGRSNELKKFMESMYGSAGQLNDIIVKNTLPSITEFDCINESDIVENIKRLCASDLEIVFFIVERDISARSSVGQDLLSDLSLDIYGSRKVNEMRTSQNTVATKSISKSLSLDLASLSYDLSVASNGELSDTITATPQMRVRLNTPSTMTSGQMVTIVTSGTSGADLTRGVQTSSGITVSTSLTHFDEFGAQIVASVEVSDISNLEVRDGFARLSNNSSKIETAREIEYNTAFLLGSLDYQEETLQGSGQVGLRSLPVLGILFSQTESANFNKEVVVLGILQQPERIAANEEGQFLSQISERGVVIASSSRRQPIAHTMPPIRNFIVEIGLLDPL